MRDSIKIQKASQHNLKGIDLELPLGELIAITGVSGSGKSSLAFNTLYAEGQRRYVETFSPYARQFLDRMDRPVAKGIEEIPPAIAINQTNPIKTSRSTVGTMTQITDYMKLLFARCATLHCKGCGRAIRKQTPQDIFKELLERFGGWDVLITFPLGIEGKVSNQGLRDVLISQGFRRVYTKGEVVSLDEEMVKFDRETLVVFDRISLKKDSRARVIDSIEGALRFGKGQIRVIPKRGEPIGFSTLLHCPDCNLHYKDPTPALFSFNNPVGACPECHGFGKVTVFEPDLVVPDSSKSLKDGAIRPWATSSRWEEFEDLMRFCKRMGIPVDVPFRELSDEHKRLVIEGGKGFYGVRGFFEWLKTKRYKMHIRILLSKYRGYGECKACNGKRFQPHTLLYRLGGKDIGEIYRMSIEKAHRFFSQIEGEIPTDDVVSLLFHEIGSRLRYLLDVGLGYLTLDRQSRTLSGGEVERVSLTSALGSSLVNTLYVLDEPTIGLHPRDTFRLIRILHNLRDMGNTVVVVEHDPDLILSADLVVDLGPGPGEEGGRVVALLPPKDLLKKRESLTGRYLSRKRTILPKKRRPHYGARWLRIVEPVQNNLKGMDVAIPLGLFVCVTGVSGSGKSTLVEEVLYRGVKRRMGHSGLEAGRCRDIEGWEALRDIVLVDQSPIGRTPRSNPLTYIKAFDPIRDIFASVPLSIKRGYTPSTFSFNTRGGRCEVCKGAGAELVEMQFLSDILIPCPVCKGQRFKEEVLDVRYMGKNISDVFGMTVSEAKEVFGEDSRVWERLKILEEVGLSYLRLGQPLTTLSGGEAQRLKLASHLSLKLRDTLFLFDEPTTGLHPYDIERVLRCFHGLVDSGNTVLVIEHNMDVIASADYIIDLGPEGGDEGGEVVVCGTPEEVAHHPSSHTGRFLKLYMEDRRAPRPQPIPREEKRNGGIRLLGAREHNLKGIDLMIPRGRFVVITGVSGSGKSTIAFDILFAEGQRRYLDTLSLYCRQYIRQLHRPEVDSVLYIPPTVAIQQRRGVGGRRSTVATLTEIYHFLRLLYAKVGTQYCPECGIKVRPKGKEEILREILTGYGGRRVSLLSPLIKARKGYHKGVVEFAKRKGFKRLRVDGKFYDVGDFPRLSRYREHTIDLFIGEAVVEGKEGLLQMVDEALDVGDGEFILLDDGREAIFSTRRVCPRCGMGFGELDPRLFSFNSKLGACSRCDGLGVVGEESVCPDCDGKRLNRLALSVRIDNYSIADIVSLSIKESVLVFDRMRFDSEKERIALPIIEEIISRLRFLMKVGLPYLTLGRSADTLAGGEIQRLRIAASLGSNLHGVCYILDEPTIGLHPRDNEMLLSSLSILKERGNTVVVVEHDEATIRKADHIIDLGPGGGHLGGRVVFEGRLDEVLRTEDSLTGRYLKRPIPHSFRPRRDPKGAESIRVVNARRNNLKGVDIDIPLHRFVCVTGVSGAGKSSLVRDVLYNGLKGYLSGKGAFSKEFDRIEGWEKIQRVLEVDQSPIGRTPRSCPATYIGVFDEIRRLFSSLPEARARGYGPDRFSFNIKGGRCEICKGAGRIEVRMSFLPDVYIECEECRGRRYNEETLSIQYKKKSIADVLAMDVEEAMELFKAFPLISHPLGLLHEIGLGYITLGQASPTLSGGEAQRIKLTRELAKRGSQTLYILEEPTTGLHPYDIERLIKILHGLVDRGNTVVVIEHNMDIIAEADYIIDLGPEGGDEGGEVVVCGTPIEVARDGQDSHTARFLKEFMERGELRCQG